MDLSTASLEEKIGHHFTRKELLERALTHRSWSSERASHVSNQPDDNEQLEFLGDSVLGFTVSEFLFRRYPAAREGTLSKWKSHLVSSAHLYRCALELGLGEYLLLSRGEARNGGRERASLLANAMEALIAAIHLDAGLPAARQFIEAHVLHRIDDFDDIESIEALNYKSVLQEHIQSLGLPTPRYVTVGASGPDHARVFTVEARVGELYAGRASGSSKKAASQLAAEALVRQIQSAGNLRPSE